MFTALVNGVGKDVEPRHKNRPPRYWDLQHKPLQEVLVTKEPGSDSLVYTHCLHSTRYGRADSGRADDSKKGPQKIRWTHPPP